MKKEKKNVLDKKNPATLFEGAGSKEEARDECHITWEEYY